MYLARVSEGIGKGDGVEAEAWVKESSPDFSLLGGVMKRSGLKTLGSGK